MAHGHKKAHGFGRSAIAEPAKDRGEVSERSLDMVSCHICAGIILAILTHNSGKCYNSYLG